MNCIIIHGCPSSKEKAERKTYNKHWIPWIQKELDEKMEVHVPLMPTPWEPQYAEWKKVLDAQDINEDTVLVGHSCGGGFVARYLGDTKKKIKKLILVAPAILHGDTYASMEGLLRFDIDPEIKNLAQEIIIFVSNDSPGILQSVELFSKAWGVTPTRLEGKGHFMVKDMGTNEFPELLSEILQS